MVVGTGSDVEWGDYRDITDIRPEMRERRRSAIGLVFYSVFMVAPFALSLQGDLGELELSWSTMARLLTVALVVGGFGYLMSAPLRTGAFLRGDKVILKRPFRTVRWPLQDLAGAKIHYRDFQEHHLDIVSVHGQTFHLYPVKSYLKSTDYLDQARTVINHWAAVSLASETWFREK